MHRRKPLSATVLAAGLLSGIVTIGAPRSSQTPGEKVEVVSAVAPLFPRLAKAARVGGEVTVSVRVDGEGKAVSAAVTGGHPLLRVAAKEAAIRWRFAPAQSVAREREVTLTFLFTLVLDATEAELAPIFRPPYQVEVRYMPPPHVDVNVRPRARGRVKQ